MVVTCASCLTKFNLDDSRIPAKGVKVRCSRCKHIFYVVLPPETKEEVIEDAESFAKYHEDLIETGEGKKEAPPEARVEEKKALPKGEEEKEEEAFLFSEKAPGVEAEKLPPQQEEKLFPKEPIVEAKAKVKPFKLQKVTREKKGFPHFLALLIILALLVFGVFSFWAELGSEGRISHYIEYPVKKITELWNEIRGIEKGGLIVGEYNGYEERIGLIPIYIIEGKVKNQSRFSKKYIKVKVVIFNQDKLIIAEKEAICGRIISRGELKKQPIEFLREEIVIKPETEEEMITPSGKSTPFMVIFKDLPSEAKDFKVEIVEAPNL